jgi:hypothetical protein
MYNGNRGDEKSLKPENATECRDFGFKNQGPVVLSTWSAAWNGFVEVGDRLFMFSLPSADFAAKLAAVRVRSQPSSWPRSERLLAIIESTRLDSTKPRKKWESGAETGPVSAGRISPFACGRSVGDGASRRPSDRTGEGPCRWITTESQRAALQGEK